MANYRPLIVNSSAQQIQEITDSDSLIGNGTIPVGGIILWSGTSVPSGWALCDGNNNTPDLRNTFVIGAHSVSKSGISTQAGPTFNATTGVLNESGQYEPGDVGGESAHKLTIDELATHNHNYDGGDLVALQGDSNTPDDMARGNNINTGDKGGDKYHENRPPYYALAYIMRTV